MALCEQLPTDDDHILQAQRDPSVKPGCRAQAPLASFKPQEVHTEASARHAEPGQRLAESVEPLHATARGTWLTRTPGWGNPTDECLLVPAAFTIP